jgi:hypothetical protein
LTKKECETDRKMSGSNGERKSLKSKLHCAFFEVQTSKESGGNNAWETPVPIPNTAVKPRSADDTWMATSWESRSLPDIYSSIAQLVEHAAVNRRVVGSSPT